MNTDREEERARCVAVCETQAEMLDKAGAHEQAKGAQLCANVLRLLTPAVESDTTEARTRGDAAMAALDAIAKLCGCPQWDYPGQVVRDVGAVTTERDALRTEVERLRAENVLMREIIAGRTVAPTDAEIEAHHKAGGFWTYRGIGRFPVVREVSRFEARIIAEAIRTEAAEVSEGSRWWALGPDHAPCAWPAVTTEVR